jgi:transposase
LTRVSKATSARWDHVRRAHALLAVAAHQSFTGAARTAGFRSSSTIPALITRFNAGGLTALAVAPGRGRTPTYDAATRQRILARAQQPPDRKQDGTATWSLHTLQSALRASAPDLVHLGATTIRRVLHAVGYAYQRTRTWCPTGTAHRVRKEGVVTVYDPHTAEKIRWIEHAYRLGEAVGLAVYCEDEAGPYQAIPQPGTTWRPAAPPARQPHEYMRGGTAKLLSLFRPASGEYRAQGVLQTTNALLHPWLKRELEAVLSALPPRPPRTVPEQEWAFWLGYEPRTPLPPLRIILIWDNLTGHYTPEVVIWLFAHEILPLYTPLSGSWLNMAESVQRIIVRRALTGEHPQTAEELIEWLEATVAGWNEHPTPFIWKGKRYERRQRARRRRLGGSGAAIVHSQPFAA